MIVKGNSVSVVQIAECQQSAEEIVGGVSLSFQVSVEA